MAIGLLGGSFDPPHEGHVHISREAMKRLGLDRVWWLVSPGNPLKTRSPAPVAARIAACRALIDHPRMAVCDFESRIGARHTAQTLRRLAAARRGARFVWLMGADNLAGFDRWLGWRGIMARTPVAVFARPQPQADSRLSADPRFSKAARICRAARLADSRRRLLARADPPAWTFLNIPMRPVSSTSIRAAGRW